MSDLVARWVSEETRSIADEPVSQWPSATALYEAFCRWCEREGHHRMSATKFGRRLASGGVEKRRTPRGYCYAIEILSPAEREARAANAAKAAGAAKIEAARARVKARAEQLRGYPLLPRYGIKVYSDRLVVKGDALPIAEFVEIGCFAESLGFTHFGPNEPGALLVLVRKESDDE